MIPTVSNCRGQDYNNQINKYNVGVIICVIIGKGWDRSRILNQILEWYREGLPFLMWN